MHTISVLLLVINQRDYHTLRACIQRDDILQVLHVIKVHLWLRPTLLRLDIKEIEDFDEC